LFSFELFKYFSNKNVAFINTYKSSLAKKSQINKFINFIIQELDKKGFLQPNHKRKSMIRNINNIFHRMNLSEQEIRILLGIFATLNDFNKKS
jgi:tRNA/rRNA methyltransferase